MKRKYKGEIINNDIKIYCHDKEKKYKKRQIKFEEYSLKLIKSGVNFDNKELFQIQDTKIEGEYKDDIKRVCMYFINCKRNGKYISRYYNGKLYTECFYKNNKIDGQKREWNIDGVETFKSQYINGVIDGIFEVWYDNGSKKIKGFHNNGLFDGKYKEWWESGNKMTLRYYKRGVLNGDFKLWRINGFIKQRTYYKNGLRSGKFEYWSLSGNKYIECYYLDGILDGTEKIWDVNGNITICFYKDGKKQ